VVSAHYRLGTQCPSPLPLPPGRLVPTCAHRSGQVVPPAGNPRAGRHRQGRPGPGAWPPRARRGCVAGSRGRRTQCTVRQCAMRSAQQARPRWATTTNPRELASGFSFCLGGRSKLQTTACRSVHPTIDTAQSTQATALILILIQTPNAGCTVCLLVRRWCCVDVQCQCCRLLTSLFAFRSYQKCRETIRKRQIRIPCSCLQSPSPPGPPRRAHSSAPLCAPLAFRPPGTGAPSAASCARHSFVLKIKDALQIFV
jgi:hypothetical protein